ncbi:MAG: hypothetical protein PVJ44_20200 [Desulfobacterales bacterium]|jgi:hypothetical protein
MSEGRNIVSVSWSDHLVFGQGDGKLATIEALKRRMECWQQELNANIIHWRCTRDRIKGRYYQGKGHRHFFKSAKSGVDWNDFKIVPEMAGQQGMQTYLYVTLFDEGWPLLPQKTRATSYHNRMHCQHVSWQSEFSRKNPEYAIADRKLRNRQWGVLCLGYREVRKHLIHRYLRLLQGGDFTGLFVCLRSQSRPADHADQYGFNDPIREEFLNRYGIDIRTEDFDLQLWRDLVGEYLTVFLRELRSTLNEYRFNMTLCVGVPRGSIVGPPIGNTTLQWPIWVDQGIIDELIIDQNSSKCPSMWHKLWPMHRGYGYLQNYLTGAGMNALKEDIIKTYAPVFDGKKAKLQVARQWQERSESKEKELLGLPGVDGLVFSSFRHDNPGPIRRNNWNA